MADKYIALEAAKYALLAFVDECKRCGVNPPPPRGILYAKNELEKIPASDVAPVVHGRWEVYLGGKELMCSACKTTFWDGTEAVAATTAPTAAQK